MTMAKTLGSLLLVGLSMTMASCASFSREASRDDLGSLFYIAAEQLAERSNATLATDRPLLVTTMVSSDDLKQSATFGRLASEMIASRLTQQGFYVRDITYTRAVSFSPETGVLALSREAAQLSASVNAQAIVVGTFAVAGSEIWLNVRLLKADDGKILSSVDVEIPLDTNTRALIQGSNRNVF
jgi:TolB-like protein